MTYQAKEASLESGQPLYFYEFATSTDTYRFTDSPEDITSQGQLWFSLAITHSEVKSSSEVSKNSLKISFLMATEAFQAQFIGWSPDKLMTFTLFRGHVGEAEVLTYWKGRLSAVQLDDDTVTITCESIFTSLKRAGVSPRFQRNCRHNLYSTKCGIVREDYALVSLVSSISELVLTVDEASTESDGYFTGGYIQFGDGTSRQIIAHAGDQITINRASRILSETFTSSGYGNGYGLHMGGFYVTLYPGCDRTLATCKDKFNNLLNQGGFKWIPNKNPFGGSSII